jgi:hypothetical protein
MSVANYEHRSEQFQNWLGEEYDGAYMHKNLPIFNSNGHFVCVLCYKLLRTVKENGYRITDEKRFKDEIATYVYRNSINAL